MRIRTHTKYEKKIHLSVQLSFNKLFKLTILSSSTWQTSHWSTNLVAIDILILSVRMITLTFWAGMCNTLVASGVIVSVG